MASFIQPVRPIDTAPPWDWNPGQTFVTAFNQTRLAQAEAEKLRLENELETFLIPLKQKKAAFDLDKIQYETELQSVVLDRARQAQRQSYRDEINRAKGLGGGQGGGGGGNNAPATNAPSSPSSSSDAAVAVPVYQGADAGSQEPTGVDGPRQSPQEGASQVVAQNAEPMQDAGYNFSLAGSPFAAESENPLYNLPTDDLGDRIAMNDPSTMSAGGGADPAVVADQAVRPVELSLTRQDSARGSLGTSPNMLGAENPLERMADQIEDSPRQATEQPQAPSQQQSSGDPFYDWSRNTLTPWVNQYKQRYAALSADSAAGRLKAPAFYSQREQLQQQASAMLASAIPKLDPEQSTQYEKLLQSKVEPLDALLQVSTSRPRARANAANTSMGKEERSMLFYEQEKINSALETLPEGSPERDNLLREQARIAGAISSRTSPQVRVQDLEEMDRERRKVKRLVELNPELGPDAGLFDMFSRTPIQSRDEADAYLNRLEQRRIGQLVEIENTPESWEYLTNAQRDFKTANEFGEWEKQAPENTPYINEQGKFTVKALKPPDRAGSAETISDSNPFKQEYESAGDADTLNRDVEMRTLTRNLEAYKKQRDGLKDSPAPLGSKTWRAGQWEKLSAEIQRIESRLNELQSSK